MKKFGKPEPKRRYGQYQQPWRAHLSAWGRAAEALEIMELENLDACEADWIQESYERTGKKRDRRSH